MAYIRQTKGKWRAEVERLGQRATKMFATKRDAQAWAIRKESELDAIQGSRGRTFATAVAHYRATVTPTKRSKVWENKALDRLLLQINGNEKLSLIDSARIGRWRNERMQTVSGSTIQREANLLRNIFTVAREEWRWIDHNPFRGVKLPKSSAPRTAVWPWQLIKRVLRANRSGKTLEAIQAFYVSLHTGLRLKEVLSGHFDPARRIYTLPDTKTGKNQLVPVTRRAARILPKAFTVNANEASVLVSRLCRELLIEQLTFHDARATALTLLARRVDVMTLARISRHKDLKILLNTYYRETAEQIAARI